MFDFCGEYVVVYFYLCVDMLGCIIEVCGFCDLWDEFEDCDVMVFGISDDFVFDFDLFVEKYDFFFMFLLDEDGSVFVVYDFYGEKNMFGKMFDGVFCNFYFVGFDGIVEWVYEGVLFDGYVDEIFVDFDG